jgi:hypothetical protein
MPARVAASRTGSTVNSADTRTSSVTTIAAHGIPRRYQGAPVPDESPDECERDVVRERERGNGIV